MEETVLIKGIALFSALIGVQQWIAMNVNLFDIFFITLIVAFLVSVEHDYFEHKKKAKEEDLTNKLNTSPGSPSFLNRMAIPS